MGSSLQNAGLTPQMAVVNPNGTPTMFFFRWLLAMQGAALTANDLEILESFDIGALDAALVESLAAASDAQMSAAGVNDAAAGELDARVGELEALRAFSGAARADLTGSIEDTGVAGAFGAGVAETSDDQSFLQAFMAAPAPSVNVSQALLVDTLANWTLANYNPANYATGQQFLVSTWRVTYTIEGGLWTYSGGTYIAPAASRPATAFNGAALGSLDIGLEFLASDTGVYQYWNGSAWVPIGATAVTTSFAPTLSFGGASTGITYSLQTGVSTIVGRLVTVQVNIILTSKGTAAGAAVIGGLPIPVGAQNSPGSPIVSLNLTGLVAPLSQVQGGTSAINLFNSTAAGIVALTDANFTNSSIIQATVSYTT